MNTKDTNQEKYNIKQKVEVIKHGKLKVRQGKIINIEIEGNIEYYGVILDDGHNTGRLFRKEDIKPI